MTDRLTCRCGASILRENWSNHLLRESGGPHAVAELDVAALAKAIHVAFGHGYHGGGWDHGDGDLAYALAEQYRVALEATA